MSQQTTPPGWYHAQGDPPGTNRFWDGMQWVGDPQIVNPGGFGAPGFGDDFGPMDAGGLPVDGWSRIGGRVIDWLIWFAIWMVIHVPYLVVQWDDITASMESNEPFLPDPALTIGFGLVGIAAITAYEVFLNIGGRGTPGKLAISARIVNAEDHSPLALLGAVKRVALYVVIALIAVAANLVGADSAADDGNGVLVAWLPLLLLLGVLVAATIMLFATEKRQTLWDLIGRTTVVRK